MRSVPPALLAGGTGVEEEIPLYGSGGGAVVATARSAGSVVDRVTEVATEHGVSAAQVALSWLLHQPGVTAPIVGATKLEHLDDAIAAEQLTLDADEIARVEGPHTPHSIARTLIAASTLAIATPPPTTTAAPGWIPSIRLEGSCRPLRQLQAPDVVHARISQPTPQISVGNRGGPRVTQ